MAEQEKTLDQVAKEAYFAYGGVTDHKNYQGLPMPEWEALPEKIQEAWRVACLSVLDQEGFVSVDGQG